jgi:hypothetical protein
MALTDSHPHGAHAEPNTVAEELRTLIDDWAHRLRTVDPDAVPTHGGAWTARQIIGHLIDSAANNHARFVRAQVQEELVFHGYAQDEWVEVQGYDEEPWEDLIDLWQSYNRHIARVVARIDALEWSRPRARHNLDQIGFAAIEASRLGTLEWLVVDYVAHLRHHLAQIETSA